MKNILSFFKSMLSEAEGVISSKRVIGFLGFLVLAVTMIMNSFTDISVAPSKELVEAVEFITIGALFGTSLDKKQIKVRIDDKLNRLKNIQEDESEDTVTDLIGYLILYKIASNLDKRLEKSAEDFHNHWSPI